MAEFVERRIARITNRRDFLKLGGAVALAAGAVSFRSLPAVGQTTYVEPPFLADRVSSGKLPPIGERLPKEPFVVGPGVLLQDEYMTWEDGKYGGDINIAATFATGFVNIAGGSTILRSPSQTTGASRPNVVSALDISEDHSTFTFTLRDGLKWSDGQPVTTEDVRFTFEDLYNDPDVQRPAPSELYTQGDNALDMAKLTVKDEHVFELAFSKPYGYFVAPLNSWIPNYDFIIKPAHYLKQFHKKYADPAQLDALVKKWDAADWVTLLGKMDVAHWDVGEARALEMPTLNAWILAEVSETSRVYERNPYFWHVDSKGQQLPYVDRIVNNIVVDGQAQTNAILAGEVTLASGGEVSLNNIPAYQQNAERSGLRLFLTGSFNYPILLFLNHDFEYGVEGSAWQQLISDPENRFGFALAAAMDPAAVNQAIYFGLYGDPFLNNTDHQPDLANELLDALGMKREGNGMRTGPDGKPFSLIVANPAGSADFAPVAEILREQFADVGIQMEISNITPELFGERSKANQIMASINWNDGPAWPYGISQDYLPREKGPWAPLTWDYVTSKGKTGRKPEGEMATFYELHRARREFPPESEEGQQRFSDLMAWFLANPVFIPTAGKKVAVNVVSARLRNLPNEGAPFELDTYINAEGVWFAEE